MLPLHSNVTVAREDPCIRVGGNVVARDERVRRTLVDIFRGSVNKR